MKEFAKLIIAVALFLLYPNGVMADPYLVEEPDLHTQVTWDVQPNGFLFVGYDRTGNGVADFYSLRIIVRNYPSRDSVQDMNSWYPDQLIFAVKYTSSNYFYIVEKEPTFYAFDFNEDGVWDLMYKDSLHDRVNGNEVYYDSPSGMFTEQTAAMGWDEHDSDVEVAELPSEPQPFLTTTTHNKFAK